MSYSIALFYLRIFQLLFYIFSPYLFTITFRVEAIACIEMIFCKKGCYGPLVSKQIIAALNEMKSAIFTGPISNQKSVLTSSKSNTEIMIDLEEFLLLLIKEHSLIVDEINLHKKIAFHNNSSDKTVFVSSVFNSQWKSKNQELHRSDKVEFGKLLKLDLLRFSGYDDSKINFELNSDEDDKNISNINIFTDRTSDDNDVINYNITNYTDNKKQSKKIDNYNSNNKSNNNNDNSNDSDTNFALLQIRIYEMNELFHQFISTDEDRTGTVPMKNFENILLYFHRLACNLPISHYFRVSDDISILLIEIKKQFRCGNNNDKISYIALWGTLLSFLLQINGTENYKFKDNNSKSEKSKNYFNTLPQLILKAITTVERGLDEIRASAIVKYLMTVQCVIDITLPFPIPFPLPLPSSNSSLIIPSSSLLLPSTSTTIAPSIPTNASSSSSSSDFIPTIPINSIVLQHSSLSSSICPSPSLSPFQTSSFSPSFQPTSLSSTSFPTSPILPSSNVVDMSHIPLTGVWAPNTGNIKITLIVFQ